MGYEGISLLQTKMVGLGLIIPRAVDFPISYVRIYTNKDGDRQEIAVDTFLV